TVSNVSTPSRQFRSGEVLAWLLILGIIVFVVQRNATGDKGANTDLLTTATARFRALILIETVSLQKRLGATADKRIADQNLTAIRQIEKEAISPRDKF